MLVFVLGLLLFFSPHLLSVLAPALRARIVGRIGENSWKGFYALESLLGLILIVVGWVLFRMEAPQIYQPPAWGRHVTMVLLWAALVVLFVPRDRPGYILVLVRHPMLTGVFLWSAGHLLANGDLASVMLFSSFLFYVVISRIAEFRKGDPVFRFSSWRGDMTGLGAGTVVYLLLAFVLHPWIAGVALF